MKSIQSLLEILSDGKYHSGEELGKSLDVSRAAIWKNLKKIEDSYGLTVNAVKGKGYRLQEPIELFDEHKIYSSLAQITKSQIAKLEILFDVDSTNAYLNQKSLAGEASGYIALAEHQSKGQGRRGRQWVSPFGGNIYLSLLKRFNQGPAQFGCLGLVIAVAIVRVLHHLGIKEAGVKWPNDIYWHNKKLAGILLEMRGESAGPSAVVIGIGVNISMPINKTDSIEKIDQPWVDIESILNKKIERNRFAASLIDEIFKVLDIFPEHQDELLAEWQQMDVLKGQSIEVLFPDKIIYGVASGISKDGALRVEHDGTHTFCHSGDVSIRRG